MLKGIIIIALLYVTYALARSSFIDEYGTDNRAEIFKLTDDYVPIIRISLPDNEYEQLKKEGAIGQIPANEDDAFKTKNATMIVELKNETKSFNKVTLKLGGYSSRVFAKQGYNIKIRGSDELYGRSQFKIRPDSREATFLRSKLACDIHNRLNLPSISANYIQLYINEDYMGFYVFMDNIKLTWVEHKYGEKDSTHLYQCKELWNYLSYQTSNLCTNENENVTDHSEWLELLKRLDAAQSAEDIEDIFDVDQFLYEMALEYLFGSWDHFLKYGHNYYMYKGPNGKWQIMLYDFDGEFGQDIYMVFFDFKDSTNIPNYYSDYYNYYNYYYYKRLFNGKEIFDYSFNEFVEQPTRTYPYATRRNIVNALIYNNHDRFNKILEDVIARVFNPTVLFPHIDQLREFIRPYVELDKTPDEQGHYPGRLNNKVGDYTIYQWNSNIDYYTVKTTQGWKAYGLKYWILMKYRNACKTYGYQCNDYYMNEPLNNIMKQSVAVPVSTTPTNSVTTIVEPEPEPSSVITTIVEPEPSPVTITTIIEPEPSPVTITTIIEPEPSSVTTTVIEPESSPVTTTTIIEPESSPVTTTVVEPESSPVTTIVVEPEPIPITTKPIEPEPISITTKPIEPEPIPITTKAVEPKPIPEDPLIKPKPDPVTVRTRPETVRVTIKVKTEPNSNAVTGTAMPVPVATSESSAKYNCWAEYIGNFKCCKEGASVKYSDYNGDWGIDHDIEEWCGITPFIDINGPCWSEDLGFSCCKDCKVQYSDDNGQWGYENNNWCGIHTNCSLLTQK